MKNNKNQIFITGIGVVVLVLAFLFGSTGITAFAANNALPGDTLYGVKTTLEQTRISLAQDAAVRAGLYLQFAETRLQEISRLISEKRFKDISGATLDFETYTRKAIAELEVVAKSDPQQAAVLTAQISEGLSRYARTLTSMLDSVPDPVRQEISQAIQSSQGQTSSPVIQAAETEFTGFVETIVEGAWVIGGKTVFIHTQTEIKGLIKVGDYVKVHVVTNSDGDLVAREIELTDQMDVNSNDNANGNDNSNANTNDDNSNGNANDDNSNANTNDDNSNGNTNDDYSNGNTNDDNSNANTNDYYSNGNTNDDNSNANDSGSNSNSNTNDDHSGRNSGNDNSRGKSK